MTADQTQRSPWSEPPIGSIVRVERDSNSSELGLCFGEHTVYLVRHR